MFDTGGLDIKPSAGMRLMKKDMGGAAHALALGRMVMAAKLPVRLVVLIPVVENAISGDAMRPGDVLASRKGLTIEVGNTDAEGRLILADALARAAELEPALTIDLATLTGAARVALGPQLPPFYTDDEGLAGEIERAAKSEPTPSGGCRSGRATSTRSTATSPRSRTIPTPGPRPGSVTAALFLQRFAPAGALGALRHLRLEPAQPPGPPGGRRGPGDPRPLPDDPGPVRLMPFETSDARVTPIRDGIASRSLEGIVRAEVYLEPTGDALHGRRPPPSAARRTPPRNRWTSCCSARPSRSSRRRAAASWVWGQARRDGYVGFVAASALQPRPPEPTHRIAAIRTYAFAEPSIKTRASGPYSMNALVAVEAEEGRLAKVAGAGWMAAEHLAPIGTFETDLAAVAERFLGAPYLWGGRESLGLDCSGLVQQALFACGLACPRDADQQAELGREIGRGRFGRGDLVFWNGHVAIGLDAEHRGPRQRLPHGGGDRAAGHGRSRASRRRAWASPTRIGGSRTAYFGGAAWAVGGSWWRRPALGAGRAGGGPSPAPVAASGPGRGQPAAPQPGRRRGAAAGAAAAGFGAGIGRLEPRPRR